MTPSRYVCWQGVPQPNGRPTTEAIRTAGLTLFLTAVLLLPTIEPESDMPQPMSDAEYLAENVVHMPRRPVTEEDLAPNEQHMAMLLAMHRRAVVLPMHIEPAPAAPKVDAEPTGQHRTSWISRTWLRLKRALG